MMIDEIELNRRAWENAAERFSQRKVPPITEAFAFFSDSLPEGSRILDLGCGTGVPFARHLNERGFQVLCVDVSLRMLKLARTNVPSADFRQLSMTDLDYSGEFSGVVASYSMLLLRPANFRTVATKIGLALRDGGLCYVSLNEQSGMRQPDEKDVEEILGQTMYSRGYTKQEVLDSFAKPAMKPILFRRQTISSAEFGIEHMMEFVFEKARPAAKS
jgi:SAM-dependent methyltransferase